MGAVWATSTTTAARTCCCTATVIWRCSETSTSPLRDVTEKAGLRRWVNSDGAIWLDYDRDGLLIST